MAAMVRTQSLRGYRELVKDLGGNPTRLLRKAGIEPTALDQLTAFTSFESLIDLLELSAADLDCSDFGLRLAERQDVGILGILSVAMLYSATVGEAMYCASKYLHVYNAAIAFTINTRERPGQARLEFGALVKHTPRWADRRTWHRIGIPHYDHVVGGTMRPATGLVLPSSRGHRGDIPIPLRRPPDLPSRPAHLGLFGQRPAQAHQRTEQAATRPGHELPGKSLPRGPTPFTAQVRQAVETLLGTGTCGHRQVANTLHMHPRSMQRRLQDEGKTFEEIKDDVRRDLAHRYLSQPDVPLSQVTALLDYNDQSSMSRGCRRWFRATPREYRDRVLLRSRVPSTADG